MSKTWQPSRKSSAPRCESSIATSTRPRSNQSLLTRSLLLLLASWMLQACSTLTPRAPLCDFPPVASNLTQECEVPSDPLPDGKFTTLYLQQFLDLPVIRECRDHHNQLVAVIKDREKVCARLNQSQEQNSKPWWKF